MMHTIIILDFETTGLNPYLNDIIEIAIKEYGSDKYYQTLVEPKRLPKGLVTYIPPHITNITSITDQMIINESITKEKAFYNMLQYIETVSKDDNPIYLVSHNGTTFDFIIFRRLFNEYCKSAKFTRFKDNLIKRIEKNQSSIQNHELISEDPSCTVELPFDKVANSNTLATLEVIVQATIRVYLSDFLIRTFPIFSNIHLDMNKNYNNL